MPFLMDSYTFSPVPWKGKDPLKRMKRITPEKDNAIISLLVHELKGCSYMSSQSFD